MIANLYITLCADTSQPFTITTPLRWTAALTSTNSIVNWSTEWVRVVSSPISYKQYSWDCGIWTQAARFGSCSLTTIPCCLFHSNPWGSIFLISVFPVKNYMKCIAHSCWVRRHRQDPSWGADVRAWVLTTPHSHSHNSHYDICLFK